MKILVIGDFHGKFPAKLKKLAKGVDLIVSVGDYFPFSYRKLFFKYSYGKEVSLWETIGKKKVKDYILKDLKTGEKILKSLNEIGVPVISVVGNIDYARLYDVFDVEKSRHGKIWKWEEQDFFSKIVKKYKNIHRFDYA
jgi:Icc-related predicted phosphoesterase